MGRTLQGAIIPTNLILRRSQKAPMTVKRPQRVRRAVRTIRILQVDRTTQILQVGRTILIRRAAQHLPRHQGQAIRAAELDRIWIWSAAVGVTGKNCQVRVFSRSDMAVDSTGDSAVVYEGLASEGLAAVQDEKRYNPSMARQIIWVKRIQGWGCSDCAWMFIPSGPPRWQHYRRHETELYCEAR
jgi:hypothetical protein